jgi:hypothetical protein
MEMFWSACSLYPGRRILYFFRGRQAAILAHALTKEDVVSSIAIERAIKRKKCFEANPKAHTYESKD